MHNTKDFWLSLYTVGDAINDESPYSDRIDEIIKELPNFPPLIREGLRKHCRRVAEMCQALDIKLEHEPHRT